MRMYAHIITNRLGNSDETNSEIDWALKTGNVISDQSARTIASWWHSPRQNAISALSHGLPFDTGDLIRDIDLEIGNITKGNTWHRDAIMAWVENLEEILEDNEFNDYLSVNNDGILPGPG